MDANNHGFEYQAMEAEPTKDREAEQRVGIFQVSSFGIS
jgi:hypothetical protein